MEKYNFNVAKLDNHFGDRHNGYKTHFKTDIRLKNKDININIYRETFKIYRRMGIKTERASAAEFRNINSITEREYNFNVDEIESIKFKIGYAITSFSLITFFAIFFIIVFTLLIGRSLINCTDVLHTLEKQIIPCIIALAVAFGIITFKTMEITLKDKEETDYPNDRKILIPISSVFFMPIVGNKRMLNLFINDVKQNNPNIKYKRDKFIIITLIIMIPVIKNLVKELIEIQQIISNHY